MKKRHRWHYSPKAKIIVGILIFFTILGIIIELCEEVSELQLYFEQLRTNAQYDMTPSLSVELPVLPFATRDPSIVINDKKVIYLTFDDGPNAEITGKVMDILKSYNIKATFFILNYASGSEEEQLVIRAIQEGHTVGLHGTSHDYPTIYSSVDALMYNFTSLQEKVYNSTGYYANIIRFPGGSSNTVSRKYCIDIMTKITNYLPSTDFIYFDWNIDSDDAGYAQTAKDVYVNVVSGIKEGRPNVVLMHDTKYQTLEALEAIIIYGLQNGYEFRAITEKTTPVHHNIFN